MTAISDFAAKQPPCFCSAREDSAARVPVFPVAQGSGPRLFPCVESPVHEAAPHLPLWSVATGHGAYRRTRKLRRMSWPAVDHSGNSAGFCHHSAPIGPF